MQCFNTSYSVILSSPVLSMVHYDPLTQPYCTTQVDTLAAKVGPLLRYSNGYTQPFLTTHGARCDGLKECERTDLRYEKRAELGHKGASTIDNPQGYFLGIISLFFWLPLLVLVVLYSSIARHLTARGLPNKHAGSTTLSIFILFLSLFRF